MTKEEATMWAAVARRIGLDADAVVYDSAGGWVVHVFRMRVSKRIPDRYFDPPNNPADERMLWDWLVDGGNKANVSVLDNDLDRSALNQCRVTALGRAIYALPEVGG